MAFRRLRAVMAPSVRHFVMGLSVGMCLAFLVFSYVQMNYGSTKMIEVSKDGGVDGNKPMSHEEFDKSIARANLPDVHLTVDKHMHHDDDAIARKLSEQVRVLVWVMTSPDNLKSKARIVRDTWAKRCNKIIFFSSEDNASFPTVGLNVPEGREHLTAKTMKGFRYVYEHHFNDADWFMKADDDTYLIVENLRYFLSGQNTSEPVYFGHHFKTIVKQGYYSGGGGYVLSKEALKRLGEQGNNTKVCRQDGGAEDAELGTCMQNLGVRTANSTDILGRSRFHCFDPETHLFGGYPDWYYQYDANGAKKGRESISDYAISFHYVPPEKMLSLEFYIYHLRPYGINSGEQDLNQQKRLSR
ncbi:glycoprotein-N-acetylgalactosamine 3-beta-galactosyltransferase 1-B-like isoform X2 [Physella acuta]|uniref:glycoprotein-N-acetylgalactosamine 3-beta-galactosyltransferase 1-B-like isoform X2 n=1 Tax=Physella acuta TaxID=109671 RepID=UPI0027DE7A41|nr:glycoprotein-N-acetylgalactosamine 3-beta-galactosyltransferase 1-B-like isoform X2 [Physella acuta]